MLTSVRYILLTAFRDWLFVGLIVGVLLATAISAVLGSTAFLEEQEMTIAFASGAARIIMMVGLIVFVCFHIRSAFDNKEIDIILSRPISRSSLVVAYWLGFSCVAALITGFVVATMAVIGAPDWVGFAGWAFSLLFEAFIVVALALFSAFAMRSAVTAVIACMGFYVISRMMAFFVITVESPMFSDVKFIALKYGLITISSIIPRLDFFAKTEWLSYGFTSNQEWIIFIMQSLIFVPLLLLATIVDFKRKQF